MALWDRMYPLNETFLAEYWDDQQVPIVNWEEVEYSEWSVPSEVNEDGYVRYYGCRNLNSSENGERLPSGIVRRVNGTTAELNSIEELSLFKDGSQPVAPRGLLRRINYKCFFIETMGVFELHTLFGKAS